MNGSFGFAPASGSGFGRMREVVGTDETFFEDDGNEQAVRQDLFTEKAGILDGDADNGSRSRLLRLSNLEKRHRPRPGAAEDHSRFASNVVYATKPHSPRRASRKAFWPTSARPRATMPWPGSTSPGCAVTESQFAILKAAECEPTAP